MIVDEKTLQDITDALLKSYDLPQLESPRLPAVDGVVAVLGQIKRILFPGYYVEECIPFSSQRFRVGTWLGQLAGDLGQIIEKACAFAKSNALNPDFEIDVDVVVEGFIRALPGIRAELLLDAHAALEGDPAAQSIEEVILTYPGFNAISTHRIAHWLYLARVPFLPRMMAEHAHTQTGVDIHPGATIGRRFFIDHGTGVVIGETTVIGDAVKIYQGVTLGALSVQRTEAGSKRHPTIEDNVVIYAGATVLGGATRVGCGATLGANVWVTEPVPAKTTVVESVKALSFRNHEHSLPPQDGDGSRQSTK